MNLHTEDLLLLAHTASEAATRAAAMIADYATREVLVEHKAGGDSLAAQVVTEVDLKSEAIIVEALQPSRARYDLALLTEESADDQARLRKDYFWCVDPMDGTLAFTESVPGYAVSIALVARDGTPLVGVVHDPVTQTQYVAVPGQGVTRNGEPFRMAPGSRPGRPLTLVCDRGFTGTTFYPALHGALGDLALAHGYTGLEVIERNGAVLNAISVLLQPPALYFKCPKPQPGGGSLWDFAASAALFREAGAFVSDMHGQPLDLNRADSPYMNHRGVLYATDPALARDVQGLAALCQETSPG